MSVILYNVGDLFTFISKKSVIGNPKIGWANTYDFKALISGEVSDLETVADNIELFERGCLGTSYRIDEIRIATFTADSHPYDPAAFKTVPYGNAGTYEYGSGSGGYEATNLRLCAYVKKPAISGRNGKLFLRGFLDARDVVSDDVTWALSPGETVSAAFTTAVANITPYANAGDGSFQMCVVSTPKGTTTHTARSVAELQLQSAVSDVKLDHKYFNRT